MAAFGKVLPRIRARVKRDLRRPGLAKDKVLATIVRLLEPLVEPDWFDRIEARVGDVLLQDFGEVIGDAARVLVIWDAHGFEIASLVLGLIFAVATAGCIYLYINNSTVSIDGLSFFLGSFFGCSVGAFIGALLANFAFGAGSRPADISSEY